MENRAETFCIRLADIVFRIEPMYSYLQEYCKDYVVQEPGEIVIRTGPEDIDFERRRSVQTAEAEPESPPTQGCYGK